MKKIMIFAIGIFLAGCKHSEESSIKINAPINEVWNVVSDLGGYGNSSSISNASLSPSGEATIGAEWILYMGKDYHKSVVTVVERMKRIETELVETQWSDKMTKWNESITLNGGPEFTEVSWKVDCDFKGTTNLVLASINDRALKDLIDKRLESLKGKIEKR